jgi:uncharacterized cupin superfamily protein
MPDKTIDSIVVLAESKVEPDHAVMTAPKAIGGDLHITDTCGFTSADGNFYAGVWESTPGEFHANYTEDEFYYLIEGSVTISDLEGGSRTFEPGDCIVVPAGFVGTWKVTAPTRKFYAHYRPAGVKP